MKAKKGEEKGKWQKAIIGIVMATIMLGSVLVAMVPTSVGRPAANQIDAWDTVYIGEQGLVFDTDGDGVYGGVTDLGFILEGTPDTPAEGEILIVSAQGWTVPFVIQGKYVVAGIPADEAGLESGDAIYIDKAKVMGDIILNTPTQDSIVGGSVPTSSEIVFKIETNFGWGIPGACVDIKLIDPSGVMISYLDDQPIRDIPVLGTTMFVGNLAPTTIAPPYPDAIGLTDLDVGTYTVRMKTDKVTCNMLDISSPEYEFTVREEEFSIEAEKDTVYRGEDIVLNVTGNPKAFYYLTVIGVDITAPPEIKDVADVKALSGPAVISPVAPNLAAWVKTGIDGIADIKIATTGADDRTYTINVYDTTEIFVPMFAPDAIVATSPLTTDDDSVDVEVLPPEVIFDMPSIATVGEEVTIRGAISAGGCVDIVIEDVIVFDDEPVDKNNEFEVDWDTSGLFIGPCVIDVYIDCPISGWMDPYAYYDIDKDGSTVIWLVAPRLTAEQPRNVIAEGDDYAIEGTATGVDDVDIVLVGPVGYPHMAGFDVLNDLEITSTSVSGEKFSEDVTMTEGVNTGTWIAMVFSPGRDGVYGDSWGEAGNLNSAFPPHIFAGKTQDQIVEILKDYTIDVAGSDDLLCLLTFRVDSLGFVEFRPIEPVVVGEPLNVSGTTNREPGTTIAIWTIEGPIMLPPVIAKVEWPTADQGVFSATINSSGAVPGTYTLEANDGEGNTDTATVEIHVPSPPAPEVSISTDKKEYSPGDVINTTIRLSNPAGSVQNMLFKWYFIRDYNNWTEIEQTTINLSANSDQSSMTSISVDDWGNESFCGCYIVSLTNMTTNNIVSVDSASWIYLPSAGS